MICRLRPVKPTLKKFFPDGPQLPTPERGIYEADPEFSAELRQMWLEAEATIEVPE